MLADVGDDDVVVFRDLGSADDDFMPELQVGPLCLFRLFELRRFLHEGAVFDRLDEGKHGLQSFFDVAEDGISDVDVLVDLRVVDLHLHDDLVGGEFIAAEATRSESGCRGR